jgi:predicted ATPase/DNA-binding winged helix-turn-helix (wHTH) protein
MTSKDEQSFAFGPFVVIPARRLLMEDGRQVQLGSRALDILIELLARAGEVVSKTELMSVAWPNVHVGEANLRVHIGALRKAIGDHGNRARFIENVPGRGYCFVAKVTEGSGTPSFRPSKPASRTAGPTVTPPIGREKVVEILRGRIPRQRLVTIVGPGGIGKTTVALAVAQEMSADYPDGTVFVDLAPLGDAALVIGAVAAAIGLPGRPNLALDDLKEALCHRRTLIVLDSCEHVIEASAILAERIIQSFAGVDVLATSREPLRAKGEWIERLPPLGLPPAATSMTAAELMNFPAVQLFVDRAASCLGGYELTDADAAVVAEICRRIDGIALAIELAAGRVDTLGIRGLAVSLKDNFLALTRGRRTALARHQTMRATLDWSFTVLPDAEQALFRRLAVFNGGFSPDAARAVTGDDEIFQLSFDELIVNLVDKSLVTAGFVGDDVQYRLLETTRAYGLERLASSGEANEISRRHASTFRKIFEQAEAEWEARPAAEWLDEYASHIDNLRAALDWCFSDSGDRTIAVVLTATAVPLWFQLSLVDECLRRVAQALAALDAMPDQDLRRRMQLYGALGWPQMRAISGLTSGAAAWKEALRLSEVIGDQDYQQRALWALWVDRTNHGESREALAIAENFSALAVAMGAPAEERIADRMKARSLYLLGDLSGARDCVGRMLDRYVPPAERSHVARFQYDQRLLARITLARLLWLQGYADQARREIESSVETAGSIHHTLTLAHVLSDAACPVALMIGDLDQASRYTAMLGEHTKIHSLDVWHTYAEGFAGEISIRRGDVAAGLDGLRRAIETLAQAGFVLYETSFLASLALGRVACGQIPEALVAVDRAIATCGRTGEAWLLAELHRIRGEAQLRMRDARASESGEASLLRSLEIARGQGAVAWELRTATSLARHWHQASRAAKARTLISAVLEKFTEGFATADHHAATALLADIGSPPA